ncbi:50S ribosomal protein L11 methyltransferase [Prevotella sp. E2-28]|uniref:50S ribosomal protein L11 methyltransferase n=1 Tax=Prevotella sp. E2-28 TaxID=2913620 RepID=UPI001EDA44EF|nr:50S ribosomal protein L11 methyltransferase [Prevotella sp. E2-28]UKK52460.1 50S ribosomal protein L11 methyltransferase [Prevotella sp. E2-28]
MKYFEVNFTINAPEEQMQDARDILSALAGEAGFETFEDTDEGVKGYVQQALFDEDMLRALTGDFPLPSCEVSFVVSEAEDKDWNEQWEQEGFEPIVVKGEGLEVRGERLEVRGERLEVRDERLEVSGEGLEVSGEGLEDRPERTIIIHDGRHMPQNYPLTSNPSPLTTATAIEIDARLAFGTGTHETTRMMVGQLMGLKMDGRRVLDCGTGTGILGIAALKLGAAEAVGYDIDEWSADNARHNAVINMVDNRFTSLLGDAAILKEVEGLFDVVLANINRNILLNDMEAFVSKMAPNAILLLSGFYEQDILMLEEKAASLGLKKQAQQHDGDWACLKFIFA